MRVSTRFPIAVHIMLMIGFFSENRKVTGDFIAQSTGNNPVVVRNIMAQLKKCGFIHISPGVGGAMLSKDLDKLSLWDIYSAVESVETKDIFKIHNNTSSECYIGSNISELLVGHFDKAVDALRHELSNVSLASILEELSKNRVYAEHCQRQEKIE